MPFTYSVEKVGLSSIDAFNVDINTMYDKIEWLKQSEDSRVIQLKKLLTNDGFILANLDVAGFYRVNYDRQSWDNIAQQLNINKDVIKISI